MIQPWLRLERRRRHDPDFVAAVREALANLDGTDAAAVSLMTGLSAEEINDLGGTPG